MNNDDEKVSVLRVVELGVAVLALAILTGLWVMGWVRALLATWGQ